LRQVFYPALDCNFILTQLIVWEDVLSHSECFRCCYGNEPSGSIKGMKFRDWLRVSASEERICSMKLVSTTNAVACQMRTDKTVRIYEESVISYFKVLSYKIPGESVENHAHSG
jgi:hypothetical protein